MTVWAYVGVTAREGITVADLPLASVRFSEALNGHGQLSATILLAGLSDARKAAVLDATEPLRRAVYASADGHLRWGGLIWTRDVTESGDGIAITAQEWGSYFATVVLRSDKSFKQVDQLAIVRDLIATHQAVRGGNARVVADTQASGVLRDRTYLAGDLPVIGELIDHLANVNNGFDYAWPAELDANGYHRGRLQLGYPTIGTTDPAVTVELPRSYGFAENAAAMAVESWATGKKLEDGTVPVASARDDALLDAGYLLTDKVRSYQDIEDDATLRGHAVADQQANGGVLSAIRVTVGMSEVLGTGTRRGDQCRVKLTGARFPATTTVVPGTSVTASTGGTADAFSDVFSDIFGSEDAPEVVTTPPTVVTVQGSFEAVLRIASIDYDPAGETCDLILAPRITLGGRIPTPSDDAAVLGRLVREVRLLSVSS